MDTALSESARITGAAGSAISTVGNYLHLSVGVYRYGQLRWRNIPGHMCPCEAYGLLLPRQGSHAAGRGLSWALSSSFRLLLNLTSINGSKWMGCNLLYVTVWIRVWVQPKIHMQWHKHKRPGDNSVISKHRERVVFRIRVCGVL